MLIAKKRAKNKLVVFFQPHRYTRTDKLWHHFIDTFLQSEIDHLVITDIYPASEAPIAQVTAQALAQAIAQHNPHFTVSYVPYEADFSSIKKEIGSLLHEDDLLLVQGAGKSNRIVDYL